MSTTQAATITLNQNGDGVNSPWCTLRNAILSANQDISVGNCVKGDGADVVNIADQPNSEVILYQSADLLVTSDITIEGGGKAVTRNIYSDPGRMLRVSGGAANLTINDLRITGGNAINVAPSYAGGAILMENGGSLTLNRSTLENNTASFGGAIANRGTGSLSINQSTIRANNSSTYGGGLFLSGANSTDIKYSTISGNTSYLGGGIQLRDDASLTLKNSTMSANTADGDGSGGAIYNKGSSVTIDASTLDGNSAAYGGGVFLNASDYTGSISLTNTIIANSINGDCDGGAGPYGSTSNYFIASGVNLVEDGAICGFTASATMLTTDPQIGSLADNGGLTLTHYPQPGGPVIDTGDNAVLVGAYDQRGPGFSRIVNTTVDIGAVEYKAPVPQSGPDYEVSSSNDGNDGSCDEFPGHCSLREALSEANSNADASVISFHPTLASATITVSNQFRIESTVTIQGGGIDIDADGNSRLFIVDAPAAAVAISDVTMRNGVNMTTGGGALYLKAGSLTLEDCTFYGNSTFVSPSASGGAIIVRPDTSLSIDNSSFTNNQSSAAGGAISSFGVLSISNSSFSNNRSATNGGAIMGFRLNASPALLTIESSTISGNTSTGNGGGIWNSSSFSAANTSIIDNHAEGKGGGISTSGGMTLEQSTLSINSSVGEGAAIFQQNGASYLSQSTLVANSTSTGHAAIEMFNAVLNISNTALNNGATGDCYSDIQYIVPTGTNFFSDNSVNCSFSGTPVILTGDSGLGPLGDNGGSVPTHLPLVDSQLIDAGDDSVIPAGLNFDQRGNGFVRVLGLSVDIGATEFEPDPPIFKDGFE